MNDSVSQRHVTINQKLLKMAPTCIETQKPPQLSVTTTLPKSHKSLGHGAMTRTRGNQNVKRNLQISQIDLSGCPRCDHNSNLWCLKSFSSRLFLPHCCSSLLPLHTQLFVCDKQKKTLQQPEQRLFNHSSPWLGTITHHYQS